MPLNEYGTGSQPLDEEDYFEHMGTQDVALTAEEWSRFGPYGHASGLNVSSKGFASAVHIQGQE